jgi:hypothetical protein
MILKKQKYEEQPEQPNEEKEQSEETFDLSGSQGAFDFNSVFTNASYIDDSTKTASTI